MPLSSVACRRPPCAHSGLGSAGARRPRIPGRLLGLVLGRLGGLGEAGGRPRIPGRLLGTRLGEASCVGRRVGEEQAVVAVWPFLYFRP